MSPNEIQARLTEILRERGPRIDERTAEDVFNAIWAEFEVAPRLEIAALRIRVALLTAYVESFEDQDDETDTGAYWKRRSDTRRALTDAGFPWGPTT